jgi:hypothetical protein
VVTPRAALVIEPPQLALGATASVEIAVATPPEYRVAPISPPDSVAGLWILEVLQPAVEMRRERWTHRFRFHVRSRSTGRFVWPEVEIPVESPEGALEVLRVAARPFEVVPVLAEETGPHRFLPLQSPGARAGGPGAWFGALAGSLATLLGFALFALVRSRRSPAPDAGSQPTVQSWRQAQTTLAAARELAADDPQRAADMVSAALRLHVERRFGVRALTATTPELRAHAPTQGTLWMSAERWERLLGILEGLDGLRFLPASAADAPAPAAESISQVQRAAEQAAAIVAEDIPRGYTPGEPAADSAAT